MRNLSPSYSKGFILTGYLLIAAGVVLALSVGAAGIQTLRLHAKEGELAAIHATAKAQEEANKKKVEGDLKLKESKDAEAKRKFAALNRELERVRGNANSRVLSDFAAPRGSDGNTVCFRADAFADALGAFVRDTGGFAHEGDQARESLEIARSWVSELLRRQ